MVETHQKGKGSFPRTCTFAGPSSLRGLSACRSVPSTGHAKSSPPRAEEKGKHLGPRLCMQEVWLPWGGRKAMFWASPCLSKSTCVMCTRRNHDDGLQQRPVHPRESQSDGSRQNSQSAKAGADEMRLYNAGEHGKTLTSTVSKTGLQAKACMTSVDSKNCARLVP